ncbi:MAG: phenylalanine--tRNA ligase subunit alpha, partial [Gammaproteobacteria bacterium]
MTVLTRQALEEVARSTDLAALEQTRVRWLGKKGTLTARLKSLGALSAAERPAAGALINEAKERLRAAIEARREALGREEIERRLGAGRI